MYFHFDTFRTKAAPLSDSRVKIIHEIVLFMKVIKMYGWEMMFKKLVERVSDDLKNKYDRSEECEF
jgi:hypothetical protein